jgi:hypothetical protein
MLIQTKSGTAVERFIVYPALGLAVIYIVISYILIPEFWIHYDRHPGLQSIQKTTYTREGIEGDPVNIMISASKEDLIKAMLDAGWTPADKITLKNSVKTALYVMLNKKYAAAPVSDLFLYGRREDLSFEIVTDSRLRQRHHVRFWLTNKKSLSGGPVWAGAATFDKGMEFSHYTGEITHCISPDIDTERDLLVDGLVKSGLVEKFYQVSGIGPVISRKNGNGDLYYTDGEITVAALNPGAVHASTEVARLASPSIIETKNSYFRSFKSWLRLINTHKKK